MIERSSPLAVKRRIETGTKSRIPRDLDKGLDLRKKISSQRNLDNKYLIQVTLFSVLYKITTVK
jgi:hypothetical protein